MRTIKAEPLTRETFAPFGKFLFYDRAAGLFIKRRNSQIFPGQNRGDIYNSNWIFSDSRKETGRNEGYAGGISHNYTGNDSSPE